MSSLTSTFTDQSILTSPTETPLSILLHTHLSPLSSIYNPLHHLGEILEKFDTMDNEQSQELYQWGANILKDFNDETLFGAEFEQEAQKRLQQLQQMIHKCKQDQTVSHLFAREMESWMKTLPTYLTDSTAIVLNRSEMESKAISASSPSHSSDVVGSSQTLERDALKLFAQCHAVSSKRTERNFLLAKQARVAADYFQKWEEQMRKIIDAETSELQEKAAEHERVLDERIKSIEKTHESTTGALKSRVALVESQQEITRKVLIKETTEKGALIAQVQNFRHQIYQKEKEMQRLRDKKQRCIIM